MIRAAEPAALRRHAGEALPVMAVCGAAAALAVYALAFRGPHARIIAGLAVALAFGAVELVGRAVGERGRAALLRGARIAWPAALVLWAVPLATRSPEVLGGHLAAALGLAAALIVALRVDRESPTRIPIAVARLHGRVPGIWELALLAIAGAVLARYVQIGAEAEGNFQMDSAYYFGMARHMALTRRFEEPIIWHFLRPPATVFHAPFDYWGGLTPVVLAPVLAVFGATQHVAFMAMAVISGLSVVAFWYLLCVALPIRYAPLQLLGLGAFAFATTARNYRFDTESLPLYHLIQIGALAGLATRRHRLAIACAFLLALCRIEGMLFFFATTLVVLLRLRRSPADLRGPLRVAGGLLAAYLLRNAWAFRTLMPPGVIGVTRIETQADLYVWHRTPTSAWTALMRPFDFSFFANRFNQTVQDMLHWAPVPASQLWFVLGALGAALGVRRRGSLVAALPAVGLAATVVVPWMTGIMYHEWRTVAGLLPLIVIALIAGASALLDALVVVTRHSRRVRRTFAVCASALVFTVAHSIALQIEPYGARPRAALTQLEATLRRLDPILEGAPVAATLPWFVMAQTRSPVVIVPTDGERALAELIRRYGLRFVVVVSEAGPVKAKLDPLQEGGRTTLGDVTVERVHAPDGVKLYRVDGE